MEVAGRKPVRIVPGSRDDLGEPADFVSLIPAIPKLHHLLVNVNRFLDLIYHGVETVGNLKGHDANHQMTITNSGMKSEGGRIELPSDISH